MRTQLPPIAFVLTANEGDAVRGFNRTEQAMDGATRAATVAGKAAGATAAKYAAAGLVALQAARGVFEFVKGSVAAAQESAVNDKRLEQVARSMGLVDGVYAGVTKRVKEYAAALGQKIGLDDDDIKVVQAKLMTFRNLTVTINEQGGAFDRTTKAAFDLAATGFGAAATNAVQLGKALQDPIKGLTSLGRAGITFTAAQKEQIKALVEHGKVAAAQNLVLAAIEKQVGGVAEATVTGTQKMKAAWGEFKESVGRSVLDALNSVGDKVSAVLSLIAPYAEQAARALAAIAPYLLAIAAAAGLAFAAYKTLSFGTAVMKALEGAAVAAKIAQIQLNLAILANPYVLIGAAIVAALAAIVVAVKMVYDRSEVLRKAWSELVATVKSVVSVLIGSLVSAWKQITGQTDEAGKKGKGFGDILKTVAQFLGNVFAGYLKIVSGYITVMANVLQVVIKWFQILINIARMVYTVIIGTVIVAFKAVVSAGSWVADHLGVVGDVLKQVAKMIGDAFKALPAIVSSAFQNVLQWLENGINAAIDLVDGLIEKFNSLPAAIRLGQTIDATISHVDFTGFNNAPTMDEGRESAFGGKGTVYDNPDKGDGKGKGKGTGEQHEYAAPDVVGGSSKAKKAADTAKKALADVKKLLDAVQSQITSAAASYKQIRDATVEKFGEPSNIMKAFGSTGDVGSAISMFDQLDASMRDYYAALQKIPGTSKQVSADLQKESDAQRAVLRDMTTSQIRMMKARTDIAKALTDLEAAYSKQQDEINKKYDALDKAAEASSKAIEARYALLIPQLESTLAAANAAYDKENTVLAGLVQAREQYLASLQSGITQFVTNAQIDNTSVSWIDQLKARYEQVKDFTGKVRDLIARGLDKNLAMQFAQQGVAGAGAAVDELAAASADQIKEVNQLQLDLAGTVGDFAKDASKQWFDAGIAQQEAIVGPLKAAAAAAQATLDAANAARTADLANAQAYIDELKQQRQDALAQAKLDYDAQHENLVQQGKDIDAQLDANAKHINDVMLALQATLPPALTKAGKDAVDGLIAGLNDKGKNAELVAAARKLGKTVENGIRDALQSASPSRLLIALGRDDAAGALAMGLEQGEGVVRRAAASLGRASIPDSAAMTAAALESGLGSITQAISNSGGNTYAPTVHVRTDADPAEIGDAVAWDMRIAGIS